MEGAVLPAKSNYGEAALWVGWVAERANHLDGWRSFGEKPVASGFRRQALDEALELATAFPSQLIEVDGI